MRFPREPKEHSVRGIRVDDLKLIREFLAGERAHQGPQDEETPLKDHLGRIRELLGITLK